MINAKTVALLVLGIFSSTRVYFFGTIAISEIVTFIIAPALFIVNFQKLKRDGFLPFLVWICFLTIAMFISAWCNRTPFPYLLKQTAVLYSILTSFILFHHLLRNNYDGLGYYFVGAAISSIITIYGFNPTASLDASGIGYVGQGDTEAILNSQLFWVQRLQAFGNIPLFLKYFSTPVWYVVAAPIAYAIFILTSTISGRSAALTMVIACGLMVLCGKSRIRMARLGRHIWKLFLLGFMLLVVFKWGYSYAAKNNLLGEGARHKYELQTSGGGTIIDLLKSGRKEFFVGLMAALDNPIVGYGPHAADVNGYLAKFLTKYGTEEDYQYFLRVCAIRGYVDREIPTHSHIIGAWVHYGIMGLIFYIYIFVLIFRYFRFYSSSIPQWYGFFAIMLVSFMWDALFSPLTERARFALIMCCLYFARAIRTARLQLPYEMELAAKRNE